MRKLLLATLLMAIAAPSFAHGHFYRGYAPHHPYYHQPRPFYQLRNAWIAPVIIGGAVGYGAGYYNAPDARFSPRTYLPPAIANPTTPVAYYCAQTGGYFPQTANCPGGWQMIDGPAP